jgi:hypothetical protein
MYWGAADEARSTADDPKRRVRRLGVAFLATLLSVGGTVAMASASTPGAGAAVSASAVHPAPPAGPDLAAPPVAKPRPPVTTAPRPRPAPRPPVVKVVAHPAPPVRAAPPPAPAPAPPVRTVAAAVHPVTTTPSVPGADTCAAALSYLAAHAAPGFHFECPGYALGHQAMTCVNVAGVCPGTKLITISVVCPASYMNEAHNSWIIAGLATGSIDPYGYCP